jgi:2-isopropylmalate synthase
LGDFVLLKRKEESKMSKKLFIFDTTLRDGEQSPGAALNVEEKTQIAHHLAKLNVDVIEAGFPFSSPGDFEAVLRIAKEVEGPEICGLSRVLESDITCCWKAIKYTPKPRIHVFVGTSDIQIEGILRKTREETLKMAVDAVTYARSLCKRVEFSAMDATRTEPSYLYEVIEATIEAGANIINIPDTVGYAMPEQFGKFIRDIRVNVKNIDRVILSCHCHDDLGMAVANSLAGVKNGVQQIECTINAFGERAGNTSLEEVVMAIQTRRDFFDDVHTDIKTKEIYSISRLVSRLMGIAVPPNKAIVGPNAFAHSSGIHQDGFIKKRQTFEIMNPEDVGIKESLLVLTPRSGRHALKHRLIELGYEITDEELDRIYKRFIVVADKKKEVHDADLEAIIQDEVRLVPDVYLLEYFQIISGSRIIPTATVGLKRNDNIYQEASNGDGPVDAVYKAIDRITGMTVELTDYNIQAVTYGKDAIGEVTVKISGNGRTVVGYGASTDVIEASAKAYVNAINKLIRYPNRNEGSRRDLSLRLPESQ